MHAQAGVSCSQLEILSFLESVRTRREPRVTARQGRNALALALVGYGTGRLSGALVRNNPLTQFMLLFAATLAHQAWALVFELGGVAGWVAGGGVGVDAAGRRRRAVHGSHGPDRCAQSRYRRRDLAAIVRGWRRGAAPWARVLARRARPVPVQ